MTNQQERDYRAKRALILLRVSTPIQEEMYGWPAQEKEIREKLIGPLNLKLDEDRHIIKDTYTGLESRERPALDCILEMAKRHEFDILCMDVLDRLGRKGLAREIYRMQLRELDVRILTTDPQEHADDDTLVGEMIRLLKGYQSEEELNNIRRRTMNGRRIKAEGQKKGDEYIVLPKVVGSSTPLYEYTWTYTEKGRRDGYVLDLEVIKVDNDGIEWTRVKVVIFVFESIANGKTIRQIVKTLNDKGIPGPKGGLWHTAAISRMGRNKTYWVGELAHFRERVVGNIPGNRHGIRETRPESEQVKVPVPPIIDRELAEIVQKKLARNKQVASHNNENPQESLLRAGLAKCGHCGGNMSFYHRFARTDEKGHKVYYTQYYCKSGSNSPGKCPIASINAAVVDKAAWEYAITIIRDPSQVDARINTLRSEDPTASRRKQIKSKLAEIRDEQAALREQLATLIAKRKLDPKTEVFLSEWLRQLVDREDEYQQELSRDEDEHAKWKKVQTKLDELQNVCAEMREYLNDPDYIPPYEKKRELCEFFGICARIWKKGHSPRFKIESNLPDIVSLLS